MAASRVRAAGNAGALPRTEQDIPIGTVALISLVSLVPIGFLIAQFASAPMAGALGQHIGLLVAGGLLYIVTS